MGRKQHKGKEMSLSNIIRLYGRKTKVNNATATIFGGVVCLSQINVVR
jgi:hypothetical protein